MACQLHISRGNSKMGKVWNMSLVPVRDCPAGIPCARDCYALKSFRMYKNVRANWEENSAFAHQDIAGFFQAIENELRAAGKKRPALFRWHVAGDILNKKYFRGMVWVAGLFPDVKFLAFTKNHSLVNVVRAQDGELPNNLSVVFSAWPGLEIDNPYCFPVAYMQDGTETRAAGAVECPGNCETCALCWKLRELRQDVVFLKH